MIQPDALKQDTPWLWSPGRGSDVWKMFLACEAGDLEAVQRLVSGDPSLIRSHYEYRTPLSFAVRNNRLEVAEFLIDRGALGVSLGDRLEMARDRGFTEMERLLERKLAARYGASTRGEEIAAAIRGYEPERVGALLDASPDLLHAGDKGSNQPIHWATMTRQLPLIDELAARGADLDATRGDGARPIHLVNGDYDYRGWRDVPAHVTTTPGEVYRHLVARGATVDVWMAAATGDLPRVRELLDADPSLVNRTNDYNSYYVGCGSPLKNAAGAGHLEIVNFLLERGADPNLPEEHIAPRGHALYSAVYHGHYDIARLLLERGADPDAPVESSADPVWIAIAGGDLRMIELLASHGASWTIPNDPKPPLTYEAIVATGLRRSMEVLASFGDVQAATELLGADPGLANDPAALEMAAGRGHLEFVRLLLRHQPDLATRVTVSRPPEMAEFLFRQGMNPNRPNWVGRTPLHHFAGSGDLEGAALFLDHGADIHARDDEDRSTPLAFAARQGRLDMVKFLLTRGAKPALPEDPPWATPLAWATRRGHQEIVRLLAQTGGAGPASQDRH
jgi:ankyrin repeat protein